MSYSSSYSSHYSTNGDRSVSGSSRPVFIWFFGYIGDTFYPQLELGLSQQTMISAAKNLSETFGKSKLVLLTAVDEILGGVVKPAFISEIKSYVSALKQYAGAVYGRLDIIQFNLTKSRYGRCDTWSDCPIYNQSSLLINKLGLDGIWFDHAAQYYARAGNGTFNQMMQNLTELFPSSSFILNHTPLKFGYITELPGYSWVNRTFVDPSPPLDSLSVNEQEIQQMYVRFSGHLLLHMDAEGPTRIGTNPHEPMSIFANLTGSQEIRILNSMVYNGTHPIFSNESYATVIPIVGSWTYNGSIGGGPNYHGTLYNSLTIGNYPRSTFTSFVNILSTGSPSSATLKPSKGPVGTVVTVSGNYFLPLSEITISFDGSTVAKAQSNSDGNFSVPISIPVSTVGIHNVTATDGTNTVNKSFIVTPSVTLNPSKGVIGTHVKINGTGFAPGSAVTIKFNGSKITSATTDILGSFSANFVVPNISAGTYVVKATDSKGDSASAKFTVK